MTATKMTDDALNALHQSAKTRLEAMGLDAALVEDQSGQTSAEEHLTWLTTATDAEITDWASDLN